MLQCSVWNTFGPVDLAVRYAYGWSDATVAMMANWGTITFMLAALPLSWMLEARGLRETTLLIAALVSCGSVLRTLSTDTLAFTVLSHAGSVLNGIAGVTIMAAPPALSAAWFPPEERTTATSINQVANLLGSGVSNLLGPYLVPDWFINGNTATTTSDTVDAKLYHSYSARNQGRPTMVFGRIGSCRHLNFAVHGRLLSVQTAHSSMRQRRTSKVSTLMVVILQKIYLVNIKIYLVNIKIYLVNY